MRCSQLPTAVEILAKDRCVGKLHSDQSDKIRAEP
jgi:hypothetical protein